MLKLEKILLAVLLTIAVWMMIMFVALINSSK